MVVKVRSALQQRGAAQGYDEMSFAKPKGKNEKVLPRRACL